jgi:hypothetical protein
LFFDLLDGIVRKVAIARDELVSRLGIVELVGRILTFELIELIGKGFNLASDAIGGPAKGMESFLGACRCE